VAAEDKIKRDKSYIYFISLLVIATHRCVDSALGESGVLLSTVTFAAVGTCRVGEAVPA
jgi:hypothetical protein